MGQKITTEEAAYRARTKEISEGFQKASRMNVLLLGPRHSGKTALLNQFLANKYAHAYSPTSRTTICTFCVSR